ncbi:hypothetical protein LRR81_09230 [Metabacillus sp. GX 13764]|uniref:hypothetical protein n=1 Tax=Metabacillus kandeliae TaxID=2900151 RepID=UPI001E3B332A|nr:hypothetical protein [Metabacillus kandeliae]MCD7034418.1 hypothetical protein [Metabacillus kandeliae]
MKRAFDYTYREVKFFFLDVLSAVYSFIYGFAVVLAGTAVIGAALFVFLYLKKILF